MSFSLDRRASARARTACHAPLATTPGNGSHRRLSPLSMVDRTRSPCSKYDPPAVPEDLQAYTGRAIGQLFGRLAPRWLHSSYGVMVGVMRIEAYRKLDLR